MFGRFAPSPGPNIGLRRISDCIKDQLGRVGSGVGSDECTVSGKVVDDSRRVAARLAKVDGAASGSEQDDVVKHVEDDGRRLVDSAHNGDAGAGDATALPFASALGLGGILSTVIFLPGSPLGSFSICARAMDLVTKALVHAALSFVAPLFCSASPLGIVSNFLASSAVIL